MATYDPEPLPVGDKERLQREEALKEQAKSEAAEADREEAKTEKERLLDKWEAAERKRAMEKAHGDE